MSPILYLIDGHALAYRSYFALTAGAGSGNTLRTRSGEPTAGVFGFASILLRLLEQEKPEYLAVTFDAGHSFRDEIFKEYKATRAKMPDDLRPQMERIRQLVDAFQLPRLELEGYEADDILGSITRQAVAQGFGVKIITGDRDLLQLVDDRVIVNLAGAKISEAIDYTPEKVLAYLGVRPEQVVDYKALVGDKSDNIPGVAGIGEKTAVSLLSEYQSLDQIYAHLADIKPAVRMKLEAGRDSAYLSKELAQIRTDVKVTLRLDDAKTDHMNVERIINLFNELEFRSLTVRLEKLVGKSSPLIPQQANLFTLSDSDTKQSKGIPSTPTETTQLALFSESPVRVGIAPATNVQANLVRTAEDLANLTAVLDRAPFISLDTETTSTDPLRADLVGISLAVKENEGYYIPIGHRTGEEQLPLEQVRNCLAPILKAEGKKVVGHNLKYDILALRMVDLRPGGLAFDTMLAEWLIDPGSRRLGLKSMALDYLGVEMTHIEDLIGKGKNQINMAQVPVSDAGMYAAADAAIPISLLPLLKKKMQERNAMQLFEDMEIPLIDVLVDMEWEGIALDVPFFRSMGAELSQRLAEIEQQVYQMVGRPFNINSTQQLSDILFKTLMLQPPDPRRKTTSGHFSTSADVLDELRGKHPVVDLILEQRELSKLKSTYVDALPEQVNPRTGRVHTSFNQTGSVTGRLASSEPNLQNIPTRTELGRKVREGFVASPGNVLLSVDYSQIELRIVAHMAQDEAMLDAFRHGQDIHATTAAAVNNIPIDQVTKDMRRRAKAINFGLIYGMSAFGLMRGTDLTLAESEDFVKAYFQKFPGVKRYLDETRRLAARQGYVETLLGRRRYFPNLTVQTNPQIRNREEREAINAPIQGTAADLMKLAMIRLAKEIKRQQSTARLLLQVHDELLLEVPKEDLPEAAQLVQSTMESVISLSVPLLTEARSGDHWGNLVPLK
ncbi:MAG TPA: DNA polymerase I [Anaerolineaceae bacterium]